MTLVELVVDRGEEALESLPEGLRGSEEAAAETIENNVRRLIIDEMAVNPKYYEKMSELLDALILQRKQEALNYRAYLRKIVELTKRVSKPETGASYPAVINSAGRRALFDNLDRDEARAVAVDNAVRDVKKDDWRDMRAKRIEVRGAIRSVLGDDGGLVDTIYKIVEEPKNGY